MPPQNITFLRPYGVNLSFGNGTGFGFCALHQDQVVTDSPKVRFLLSSGQIETCFRSGLQGNKITECPLRIFHLLTALWCKSFIWKWNRLRFLCPSSGSSCHRQSKDEISFVFATLSRHHASIKKSTFHCLKVHSTLDCTI